MAIKKTTKVMVAPKKAVVKKTTAASNVTVKKKTPEQEAARKSSQTEGMTDAQRRLYNQKGKLGQKIYSKRVAKSNVKAEMAKSGSTKSASETTAKTKQTGAERRSTRRAYNLSMVEKGGRGKVLGNIAAAASTTLGALGLYNQSKRNNSGN